MPLIKLNVKYVKKGPTLKINLTTLSSGVDEATTETFVINELAQVRFKVKREPNEPRRHYISMLAIKKNDAISMNVTCNALKYSKNWTFNDGINDWKDIGVTESKEFYISSTTFNLSHLEIVITVYDMIKPAFSKLYEDCDFTDFTLSTADGKVAVHKACLAAHSPVFKAMFTGKWKEAKENLVEIKDYTLQTIQQMKDFLYLGILPDDGLRPLITLAALYSINDLKKECARKLAETVRPEDLYSLHEFACANNIPELSCAISQLTLDEVVDQSHQMKQKNDETQMKVNDEKQAEGQ